MINKLVTTFSILILVILFIIAIEAMSGYNANTQDSVSQRNSSVINLVPIFVAADTGPITDDSPEAIVYAR